MAESSRSLRAWYSRTCISEGIELKKLDLDYSTIDERRRNKSEE